MMPWSLRLPLLVVTLLAPLWTGAATLKINGSTTVNLPVAEAAEILRAEKKMDIQVDTQGGSSGGISALGDRLVQIGMSSKHLSDTDRGKYPKVSFKEIHIGEDAVALVVSRDVWDSGLRALTKAQARDIYEGRIKNWKQVGGPDRRIAFCNYSGRCQRKWQGAAAFANEVIYFRVMDWTLKQKSASVSGHGPRLRHSRPEYRGEGSGRHHPDHC